MKFRFKALAKMREPDELDAPAVLAAPRGWVTVLAITAITAAAGAWAVFGHLPETVRANGLLSRPLGVAQVQSLHAGLVREVTASVGAFVSAGQSVGEVGDAQGNVSPVPSPFAGQVISVDVTAGQVIGLGAPVVTLERTGTAGENLVAMLLVPSDQATAVAPGQEVGLAVASAPSAAFGLLRGRVASISPYPLTNAEASAVYGGPLPASVFDASHPPRLVVVQLQADAATPTGYAWSTPSGPPRKLASRVPVDATITLGTRAPITLLFA
jgi:multidrug efflux pump subunit AcrA (membrane-fusion protein)